MTREDAISVLEESKRQNEIMRDNPNTFFKVSDIVTGEKNAQKRIDALNMAIYALRQQERFGESNKALTLDELRKMPIRDWVWIEILNPDAFRSKETVSACYRKYDGYKKAEIFWCGYPGLGFGFDYADYGKTWLAYRQKPEEGTV